MKSSFSVLVCCFGNYPEYSLRAVRSLTETLEGPREFAVHVGANACSDTVLEGLRELLDAGRIDTLIESRKNINKDPMMRLLIDLSETDYFLWLDDDSYVLPGWDTELQRFISEHHPFESAGVYKIMKREEGYTHFLRKRPWYVSDERFEGRTREVAVFPPGALFLARTEFVRRHNFPDKAMIKRRDDVLLGDLIAQQRGRLVALDERLASCLKENTGARRGTGERGAAYRNVSPLTGFPLDSSSPTPDPQSAPAERMDRPRGEPESADRPSPEAEAPFDLIAVNESGNRFHREGKFEQALEQYNKALKAAPNRAELHYNIANVYRAIGPVDEAIAAFNRALQLKPDYLDAYNNLGITLANAGQHAEAVEIYRKALALKEDVAPVHNNCANSLDMLGRLEEAVQYYRRALQLDSTIVPAHFNLGNVLFSLGQDNEALLHYRLALHYRPDVPDIRLRRALVWLMSEEYEMGFKEFEHRKNTSNFHPVGQQWPDWDGAKALKRLMLFQETVEEALQFARFIPALLERHRGELLICCSAGLAPLFERQKWERVSVATRADGEAGIDAKVSLSSLPYLLGVGIKELSLTKPYITPLAPSVDPLPPGTMRIGFSWKGQHAPDLKVTRAADIKELEPLFAVPGTVWENLQGGLRPEEESALAAHANIRSAPGSLTDLDRIAQRIAGCDLIVTTDSDIAHLAGALGKEAWVFLPPHSRWPWGRRKSDTVWYPTHKLFRQAAFDSSSDALAEIVKELRGRVRSAFGLH